MIKFWILVLLALTSFSSIAAHKKNRQKIKDLFNEVKALKAEQELIYDMLNDLETNLTASIEAAADNNSTTTASNVNKQYDVRLENNFEFKGRLDVLERDIEALRNYLIGEKKIDVELQKKSEAVVKEVDLKLGEAELLIDKMKQNVTNALDEFSELLQEVNISSHLIPDAADVAGVITYGGVGSSCSSDTDLCQVAGSECRDGMCQCGSGLSYDVSSGVCVESCAQYGTTYQTIRNKIIRGYNNRTLEDTTLEDCRLHCETEEDFVCRSFDYFNRWQTCLLSSLTVNDVLGDAWEYNSAGIHFQRDCATF